jgi:carboxymethylenebutenolidase
MGMGERIKLTAADGFAFNAYRATPEGNPRGGVVVIQEVWGINSWIRSVADRFARHGYLAVAPAIFDDYDAPEVAAKRAEIIKDFSHQTALLDVTATVLAAAEGGKVGITGYCFGGSTTWRAASKVAGLSAASGYYGGGIQNYIEMTPKVPTEMHFGDKDTGIPLEQVEQLKARHPSVDIYLYDGVHGFCNSDRPKNFNEAACKKASARTLEFFHKHLA